MIDGVEDFAGIFFAEDARFFGGAEIEWAEFFDAEIKEVERILDEAAFHEFIGDDASEAIDFESPAFGEVFEASG